MVPEPVPLAGTVTHEAFELAVHAHADELIVNVTLPEPPAPPMLAPVVDKLAVQPPAWVNDTVWPATVRDPVRDGPTFAATLYVALPLPVPLDVTASQLSLFVAVHAQAASLAVIVRLPEPAAAVGDTLVGLTVNAQPLA
jgi:hypothetical protein